MNRFYIIGLIVFLIFSSSILFAEDFECVRCYVGYSKSVRSDTNPPTIKGEDFGLLKCNIDLLNDATDYGSWFQVGEGINREGVFYYILTDRDGDVIHSWTANKGMGWEIKFKLGSGKYEGVRGEFVSKGRMKYKNLSDRPRSHIRELYKISRKEKPWSKGAGAPYQFCRKVTGSIELLNK